MTDEEWLKLSTVMKNLQVSRGTVLALGRAGQLDVRKFGGLWRVSRPSYTAMLERSRVRPSPRAELR